MKVGDYVRYKDVFNDTIKIRKINEIIPPDKLIKKDVYFFNKKECSLKEDIIKSSPNIIDLIEVGDYVNGGKVLDIDLDDEIMVIDNIEGFIHYSNGIFNIKSIVTKEQFEVMKYEIIKQINEKQK